MKKLQELWKEKPALISYPILSMNSLKKCMENSLENLYLGIGASKVNTLTFRPVQERCHCFLFLDKKLCSSLFCFPEEIKWVDGWRTVHVLLEG